MPRLPLLSDGPSIPSRTLCSRCLTFSHCRQGCQVWPCRFGKHVYLVPTSSSIAAFAKATLIPRPRSNQTDGKKPSTTTREEWWLLIPPAAEEGSGRLAREKKAVFSQRAFSAVGKPSCIRRFGQCMDWKKGSFENQKRQFYSAM
jgi:hypothetical protein